MAQLPEINGAEVLQLMLFLVRPQILDRIQFQRIGRQELQTESAVLLAHEVPYYAAAVAGQSVPDAQQLTGNVAQRMREKLDDPQAADGSRKQPKVEVPPRYPRHRRQHLPVEVILQHRRLSTRRPSAAAVRALTQSAFADEDDRPAFFLGLFNSGQRFWFHIRIFSSSRSSSRPVGRRQECHYIIQYPIRSYFIRRLANLL
jgi:hypothetical protein